MTKTIAVTGATGQQGSAVARHMLKAGWTVRALTRDPDKAGAAALREAGAQIVRADNEDRASLAKAFTGADAVFSVQNYWLPNVGKAGEIRQGKLAADVARETRVPHFIYSSVGAAHRGMGQAHFESKFEIENHIKAIGLPHTIIRPVEFMENVNYTRVAISNGKLPSRGLPADKRSQKVAVDDIGRLVAHILSDPARWLGKTVEFASEELTEQQTADTLAKVIGRPVVLAPPQPRAGGPSNPEMEAMIRFFAGEAYDADIPALRKELPGMTSFEQYLRKSGWEGLAPMPETGNAWGG